MTLISFISIIAVLLIIFQILQVYFFRKKQFIYGGLFVGFFWFSALFMGYNLYFIFSANDSSYSRQNFRTIVIEKGSGVNKIAAELYSHDLIDNKNHFKWSVSLLGFESKLRAGKFSVPVGLSNYQLIEFFTGNHVVKEKVTVIEGLTVKDLASLFANKLEIDSTKFAELALSKEYAKKFGFEGETLEGYLFPDTYLFEWGVDEEGVIEILVSEFKKNLTDEILDGAKGLGMTLHEIVTMASIIEGEAVHDEERNIISSVYHNRIKKNWRLQADPTIQYILAGGPRRLLSKDLEIDSPYNTYRNRGLPPGPINNPGLKSLIAAANPSSDTYMFFVATGEGYHTFTTTNSEHLEAKKILDKNRRIERRKKQNNKN